MDLIYNNNNYFQQKLQAVEHSIGSRLQTESKKNDKSSRREAVKRGMHMVYFVSLQQCHLLYCNLDEESKELKCRIKEYKAKLEQEEMRCEECLSRLSKVRDFPSGFLLVLFK